MMWSSPAGGASAPPFFQPAAQSDFDVNGRSISLMTLEPHVSRALDRPELTIISRLRMALLVGGGRHPRAKITRTEATLQHLDLLAAAVLRQCACERFLDTALGAISTIASMVNVVRVLQLSATR